MSYAIRNISKFIQALGQKLHYTLAFFFCCIENLHTYALLTFLFPFADLPSENI